LFSGDCRDVGIGKKQARILNVGRIKQIKSYFFFALKASQLTIVVSCLESSIAYMTHYSLEAVWKFWILDLAIGILQSARMTMNRKSGRSVIRVI
jgi:hypothetical protein